MSQKKITAWLCFGRQVKEAAPLSPFPGKKGLGGPISTDSFLCFGIYIDLFCLRIFHARAKPAPSSNASRKRSLGAPSGSYRFFCAAWRPCARIAREAASPGCSGGIRSLGSLLRVKGTPAGGCRGKAEAVGISFPVSIGTLCDIGRPEGGRLNVRP